MSTAFDHFWSELKALRIDRGRRAENLIAWRRAPSSHRTARRLIEEYCSEEALPPRVDIVALEQTAGHGREGRSWSSPPSAGLYASLVRALPAGVMPSLPLLVPVALVEALATETGGRARVKWPNDVVVDGRKLGGILIDAKAQGDRHAAVISFGINIAADLDVFGEDRATSLGVLGASVSPARLFEDLVDAIDGALAAGAPGVTGAGSSPALIDRYRSLSLHRDGDPVRWKQGDEVVGGIFRGFESDGRLRLEVDGRVDRVAAGSLLAAGDDEVA
ncbi:MAG: biotin--[acetyl-CoA-carboxylase] ligase [Acidobacteriota bacterium]